MGKNKLKRKAVPASSGAATLKKIPKTRAITQVHETLQSIEQSAEQGQLKTGPDVHPFNRVTEPVPADRRVVGVDLATLLVERLEMQGYVFFHDEKLSQKSLEAGRARLREMLAD